MSYRITSGAIVKISTHEAIVEPFVQVLDIKQLETMNTENPYARYQLVISDGIYHQQVILATQLNFQVTSRKLKNNCIIKLKDFCYIMGKEETIIILDMEVIDPQPNFIIGNPIPLVEQQVQVHHQRPQQLCEQQPHQQHLPGHQQYQQHQPIVSTKIVVKVYNGSEIRRFQLPITTEISGLQKEVVNVTHRNSNSQICIFYRNIKNAWCALTCEQDWIDAKRQHISREDGAPLVLRVDNSKETIQYIQDPKTQNLLNKSATSIPNQHRGRNEKPSRILEPPMIAKRRGRRPKLRGNWHVRHPNRFPPIFKQLKNQRKNVLSQSKDITGHYSSTLTFFVNGKKHELLNVSPEMKLVEYLRENGLTGTKIGCGEGGCGACTVVLSNGDATSSRSINSCLRPIASLDGLHVTTTEGIGSQHTGFHAIQQHLADNDGSQCGYCSPGFVMSMYGLLQKNPTPSSQTIEDNFDGNICRCTGYRPIFKAMHIFGKNNVHCQTKVKDVYPPDVLPLTQPKHFIASDDSSVWFSPTKLSDVFSLLSDHSGSPFRLTVGNTSIGVIKYYPFHANDAPQVYIDLTRVPDLVQINTASDSMSFGAAVTLTTMIESMTQNGDRNFIPLIRHIKLVANTMVRNAACWAGNLMMAKTHPEFPSDLVTIFSAVSASVSISNGKTQLWYSVPDFLTKSLDSTYVLLAIKIPLAGATQYFDSWKVADRHQNSHALVNAGFSFTYDSSNKITNATLVFGNILRGPLVCTQTSAALVGNALTQDTLTAALSALNKECIPVDPSDPDPTWVVIDKDYRKSLAISLFFKFFLGQKAQFGTLSQRVVSASQHYKRPLSKGTQVFTPDSTETPVSYPIVKLSATRQASGEAIYTSDMPTTKSAVFAAYVQSTKPLATLVSIDTSQALAIEGVVDFISAKTIKEIGGVNECGLIPGDEEVFASTEVKSVGQPIGLIIATTQAIANAAASKVQVQYGTSKDAPLLTLEDAIAKQAFMKAIPGITADVTPIVKGDIDAGFAASDHVLEGEFMSGGQIHFYMETQSAIVVPEENGVFRAHCSTQDLQGLQSYLATVLNVKQHKVVMETKRAGGAYGGKISRSITPLCAVGVAAAALRRPVRMQLDRNIDMNMTGGRLDKVYKFKIGYMKDGSIKSYHIQFYGNGGWCYDGSFACLQMAMYWADNTYYIPNIKIEAFLCLQNRPSTTSVRAPGVLSSSYAIELLMETIATSLNMAPSQVRETNFYKNGDSTITGDVIVDITLPTIWSKLKTQSNWIQRQSEVKTFNDSNRWRKRGIRISPVKYGATPGIYIENVLLNINPDGTICLTQTGIEIGQGIHTKVVQTVAYKLGIKMDMIEVFKNSTEKIARTSVTGGSGTSESCCGAAIDACDKLNALLAPLKAAHPTATWEEIIGFAYAAQPPLNMTIVGFWAPGSANVFDYYVWGGACSEVEVDILTGQVEVLRVDIMYDCGQSLNPAIDIGQVEGGFIMGLGFFLTESVITNTTTGRLISNGTWEYKPPCSQDIPIEFNVTFLDNVHNKAKNAVLGSKCTGEPPLILTNSIYFATIDAIQAARVEAGQTIKPLFLNTPLTADKIQKACLVDPSQFIIDPKNTSARFFSNSKGAGW